MTTLRSIRSIVSGLLAIAILAALLASAATPAAAQTQPPETGTVSDSTPWFQKGRGTKVPHDCNRWGRFCKGHYWTAGGSFKANYYMGDIQGTYQLVFKMPIDRSSRSSKATKQFTQPRWRIWEKRYGSNTYVNRYTLNSSGTGTYYADGRSWRKSKELELDGEIIIQADSPSGKAMGLKQVTLKKVDLLPEHVPAAILMCLHDLDERQGISAIAAAVLITAAAAASGNAAMAAAGWQVSRSVIVSASAVTNASISFIIDRNFADMGDDDKEEIQQRALLMIEDGSLESLLRENYGPGHVGCVYYGPGRHFHWLHWNRGYGVYGNDIAAASSGNGEIYLNAWGLTLKVYRRS